jgi:hypothetical protein
VADSAEVPAVAVVDPVGAPVVAVVDPAGAPVVAGADPAGYRVVAVANSVEGRAGAAKGRHGWVAPADGRAGGFGESLIRTAAQEPEAVGAEVAWRGRPAWADEPLPTGRRPRAPADLSSARLCLISCTKSKTSSQSCSTAGNVYSSEYANNRVLKLPAGSSTPVELPFTGTTDGISGTPKTVAVQGPAMTNENDRKRPAT